ncbi:PRC-barrel domain-containing protein [Niveispirillum sp. KHB5.9]|uniref:PRC-barrel domain-containing protein n=1 Tax=Niveispirillum sp. KHB5.9 TaxID=3400269 RepID=UPI003A837948
MATSNVALNETTTCISADKVNGTDVYSTAGEKIGHVEDVMLNKRTGNVAYAIMAFGGFLGIGERYHPLPWSVLKYDTAKEGYVVPLDKSRLENAPSYSEQELGADDRRWREPVSTYYNVPPYWM